MAACLFSNIITFPIRRESQASRLRSGVFVRVCRKNSTAFFFLPGLLDGDFGSLQQLSWHHSWLKRHCNWLACHWYHLNYSTGQKFCIEAHRKVSGKTEVLMFTASSIVRKQWCFFFFFAIFCCYSTVHTNLILCRHPTSVYPRGMAMCSVPPVHQDLYNDMRAQFPELPDALIQSCVQLYARNRSQCIEHLTRASQEQLYSQFDSEEASGNREGLRPAVSPRLFEPLEPPFPPDQDLPPPYPGVLAPVLAPASPQSPPMVQNQRSRVDPQTPPHLPSPRLDQPPPRTDFWSQVRLVGCGIGVLHQLVEELAAAALISV